MQNPHDPFNGWQQTPGAHHDPFNKWPQTPPGAHLVSQGGGYSEPDTSPWVPGGHPSPPPDPRISAIKWSIALVVIVLVLVRSVVLVHDYLESGAYKSMVMSQSLGNGSISSWSGDEFQYNQETAAGGGHTDMILAIDSIKQGSIHGQVHWPRIGDTVTKAEGTIVAKVNHKDIQWKYVDTCSDGIYLQFTETQFIQGNSVELHPKYFAVVCYGEMSGVWFYPDQPNDALGGEFSLQWQSP